ncbi:LLM class flavin-dependent oxidoreductase [Nocardioides sp. GY 10113]|nr:LLM class flavin-dependent oxidoreductase [Nocardioides sp. GY 10113]TIC79649.1 LLM class flavin-dependent oxidoreductase [Nocardioides sp. GY 10113]
MGETWRRAEELGFAGAWVYDHLAWRGHSPWDDAYATLAAAAAVTSRMRLGTLVTSPNFRTPIPTASAVRTIDRISGGRLTLGIGAGGATHTSDGDVLDGDWTPRQRADRFAEWVGQLDALLTTAPVSLAGEHWSAREVTIAPGLVQQRPPFWIAATGPRGLRLAARLGQGWIANPMGEDPVADVRRQVDGLRAAGEAEGRDVAPMPKLLLTGFSGEPWLESVGAYQDLAGRYAELGITDVAVHWPRPGTEWDADMAVFEAIAARHAG